MIIDIVTTMIHWFLILLLAILLIVCANILGFTAVREPNKPPLYYKIVWFTMIVVMVNMVIAMHSKEIALLLSPFAFAGSVSMLFVTSLLFAKDDEPITIKNLQIKIGYHRETIKILACLAMFFFLASVYQDVRHKYFHNINQSVVVSP